MRVDLHNHTPLCNHAKGEPQKYIQQAIKVGIDIFGFSDHAPMQFDTKYRMNLSQSKIYEQDILNLKEQYKDQIDILLGYEVDYMSNPAFLEKDILNANVDYLIGSVHFLDSWGFDNPEFLQQYQNKDIDKIWEDYFEAITNMAKTNYFNIVGHLDLIKVFKFLPKKDIKLIASKALKQIKKSNMVIEINSAGFAKPIGEQYPSISLLELAFELDIPITFGSDAHSIDKIGYKYDQVKKIAQNIGYTKCTIFRNKQQEIYRF